MYETQQLISNPEKPFMKFGNAAVQHNRNYPAVLRHTHGFRLSGIQNWVKRINFSCVTYQCVSHAFHVERQDASRGLLTLSSAGFLTL